MTNIDRRQVLAGAAALGVATLGAHPARAAGFDKLEILAAQAPGGGYDNTARGVQKALQEAKLVASPTVYNVPGAGGTIALAQFSETKAGRPDSTIVLGFGMIGAGLINKAKVSFKDVTPICRLVGEYNLLVVPAKSDIKSLQDLLDRLKKDPGAVSWGGGSIGGSDHLFGSLVARAAGVKQNINWVAFSGGGDAMSAILGGQTTCGISGYREMMPHIESGALRALGISGAERVPGIDIPTMKEQGVDAELTNWRGIAAPPGISAEQKTTYLDLFDNLVKSDAWQAALKANGWIPAYVAGDDFDKLIASEQQRVGDVIKELGLIK
jgi:putative tricarboxylic transport membrane protein